MPARQVHPADLPEKELLQRCDVKRTRASGPGGQHRNKVETAIVITHQPTGIVGQASEKRSQQENLREATFRLRINLAVGIRLPIANPVDYVPGNGWQQRIQARSIQVSSSHAAFPSILAEALDVIASVAFDVSQASKILGCSTSQLVKLLKKNRAALDLVNRKREEAGQARYR